MFTALNKSYKPYKHISYRYILKDTRNEIHDLYEKIILSFMKKNKLSYFHVIPVSNEDDENHPSDQYFISPDHSDLKKSQYKADWTNAAWSKTYMQELDWRHNWPNICEQNLLEFYKTWYKDDIEQHFQMSYLLDLPISETIQEKILNYIIINATFNKDLEFLINGTDPNGAGLYYSRYSAERLSKVINLEIILQQTINYLIRSAKKEVSKDGFLIGTPKYEDDAAFVFLNKNKKLIITQQKNCSKRIKRANLMIKNLPI